MLLCIIWQKFGVYAPCSHFWGLCERAKPEQPEVVGWVPGWSWIAVESLAALYLHSPKLWVPEQVLSLHPQQTHSISWGLVFPMNLFSTSQPSWAGGKEKSGSGCTYLKHFSSLGHDNVIWENLWQCLEPCVVTKLSDASGDRQGLCAPCAAQSLTSLGSFKIQATHVHCGINSQVDDPNEKITIWEDERVWYCTQWVGEVRKKMILNLILSRLMQPKQCCREAALLTEDAEPRIISWGLCSLLEGIHRSCSSCSLKENE